jgi:hypothetical protein
MLDDSIYMISRRGKYAQTESMLVVAKGWKDEGNLGVWRSFWDNENVM